MSLRFKWCVVLSAILVIAGMIYGIHRYVHRQRFLGMSFLHLRHFPTCYGQWAIQDDQIRLLHFILVEQFNNDVTFTGSDSPFAKPGRLHVSGTGNPVAVEVIPSGIYLNEVRLPTTDDLRVFVMRRDHSLVPIPLTDVELAEFTPAFVEQRFKWSPLWRDRIRPLVEPGQIAQEKVEAAVAQEAKGLTDEKTRGIKRIRIYAGHCNEQGKRVRDLYYVSDWLKHPDGTWTHLNSFIGRIDSFEYCPWEAGWTSRAFNPDRKSESKPRTEAQKTFVEMFPSSYEINGKTVERGQTYVQRPDGSVTLLELTPEESQQFTGELLSSADRFVASDLYIRKIAPLLGERVVQSAAQATRPDVPTPPRQN